MREIDAATAPERIEREAQEQAFLMGLGPREGKFYERCVEDFSRQSAVLLENGGAEAVSDDEGRFWQEINALRGKLKSLVKMEWVMKGADEGHIPFLIVAGPESSWADRYRRNRTYAYLTSDERKRDQEQGTNFFNWNTEIGAAPVPKAPFYLAVDVSLVPSAVTPLVSDAHGADWDRSGLTKEEGAALALQFPELLEGYHRIVYFPGEATTMFEPKMAGATAVGHEYPPEGPSARHGKNSLFAYCTKRLGPELQSLVEKDEVLEHLWKDFFRWYDGGQSEESEEDGVSCSGETTTHDRSGVLTGVQVRWQGDDDAAVMAAVERYSPPPGMERRGGSGVRNKWNNFPERKPLWVAEVNCRATQELAQLIKEKGL